MSHAEMFHTAGASDWPRHNAARGEFRKALARLCVVQRRYFNPTEYEHDTPANAARKLALLVQIGGAPDVASMNEMTPQELESAVARFREHFGV